MRVVAVDGATTRELRRAVLRPGWPEGAAMHGDDNPDALHLAVLDEDHVVVAACLVLPAAYPKRPDAAGTWQLRGMATAESHRSQGLGAELIEAVLAELRQRRARLVWCEARNAAMAFYARNGFEVDGDEFLHAETGIPHHHMWRRV